MQAGGACSEMRHLIGQATSKITTIDDALASGMFSLKADDIPINILWPLF